MDTLKAQLINTKPLMGSTQQARIKPVYSTPTPMAPAMQSTPARSNAQRDAQEKAMNSAYKATKTFK